MPIIRDIIVQSIRTRVEKSGAGGGIVALSGGIDSSLVSILAHSALGKCLTLIFMPEDEVTPRKDAADARKLAKKLGRPLIEFPIKPAVDLFRRRIADLNHSRNRLALANIKPRVRMIINYVYANLEDRLVIGTSNKSELLLGYGTKFGDMAADLYPIGDLYKTQVWQLAEFVKIPTAIIQKAPSPQLWKGQTTEGELGRTYRDIDRILFALVDMEYSVRQSAEILALPEKAVDDVYRRVIRNEHKRKSPTISRVSRMCLDKDWRYPVERY
ncbi:MAG: NAD+ synthase [bacterium]